MRNHADALPVAEGDEEGARVGDGGKPGLGQEADVAGMAVFIVEEVQQGIYFGGRRMLVQFPESQFADMSLESGGRKETPRRPRLFDDEMFQRPDLLQQGSRKDRGRFIFSERRRNQV